MKLTYNGIELKLIRTDQIGRQKVYDDSGQDYLYDEWDINVQAYVNRAATSFTNAFTPLNGQPPPVTDAAIRHALAEPRRRLLLEDEDGRVILDVADGNPYVCDAKGGPYPERYDVMRIHGLKTWVVFFRVRCYVNECRDPNLSPNRLLSPLLSHRWRMRSDQSLPDRLAVRVIDGSCTFRIDELLRQGKLPDQFRQELLHPVPENFEHARVNVTATEDGSRLLYQVIDRERTHNLGENSPATQVEAYHTEQITVPTKRLLPRSVRAGFDRLMARFGLKPSDEDMKNNPIRIPKAITHLFVRCWGGRNSNRQDLTILALQIAFGRLGVLGLLANLPFLPVLDASVTEDLVGKFSEFQMSFIHEQAPLSLVRAIVAVPMVLIGNSEQISFFGGRVLIDPGPGTNPPYPNAKQSRGTWVGKLVTQAIQEACTQPGAPVNAEQRSDETFAGLPVR